ncbi:MAG: hypothetical protein OEQ29_05780 [Alphaproteobacteria bacterium]|nr:hypothetical protein [Alphaproteobacteria bacterium]
MQIAISAADVLRRNGLRFGGRLNPRVRDLVPDLLRVVETEDLLQPAIAYREWQVAAAEGTVMRLANGARIEGAPRLVEQLADATSMLAVAGTLGPRLDAHVSRLFAERQPMRALVLEEIGILAVAKLGDAIRDLLDEEAKARGQECSSPMSPGETGFAMATQPTVVALAGGEEIGITLSASGAMMPVKSLSMVLGVGEDMPRWAAWQICAGCAARERCRYRLVPQDEAVT